MDDANLDNTKNDFVQDPRSAGWWKAVASAFVEREGEHHADWPEEVTALREQVAAMARRAGDVLTAGSLEAIESRCDAIESRLDRIERRLAELDPPSEER